jgi:hypothetical protein
LKKIIIEVILDGYPLKTTALAPDFEDVRVLNDENRLPGYP